MHFNVFKLYLNTVDLWKNKRAISGHKAKRKRDFPKVFGMKMRGNPVT